MTKQALPLLLLFAILTLTLSILLTGCSGKDQQQAPMPQPLETAPAQPSADEQPAAGRTVEIDVAARNFEFEPEIIRVKQGDIVVLHMTSEDDGAGDGHGLSIPAFGVDITLRKGQTEDITFVAEQKGEFSFSCSVFCGGGHSGMNGKLIVE